MTSHPPQVQNLGRKPRRSCDQCTDLKVGCTKEKPQCSRCIRRKTSCTYSMAKRPGRRSRSDGPQEESSTPSILRTERCDSISGVVASPTSRWTQETFDLDVNGPMVSNPLSTSLTPTTSQDLESLFGLALPEEPHTPTVISTLWSNPGDFLKDLSNLDNAFENQEQDLGQGSVDYFGQTTESLRANTSRQADRVSTCDSSAMLHRPTHAEDTRKGARLFARVSNGTYTPATENQYTNVKFPSSQGRDDTRPNARCQCVLRTCMLISRVPTTLQPFLAKTAQSPSRKRALEILVADVQGYTKDVAAILDCHCVHGDGNLGVLLSLALFRILGCYRAVAAIFAPAQVENDALECCSQAGLFRPVERDIFRSPLQHGADDNLDRTALQKVLSNLHGVRSLIKRLAERVDPEIVATGSQRKQDLYCFTPASPKIPDLSSLSLPSPILQVFGKELHTSYRSLVVEILKRLKEKAELA